MVVVYLGAEWRVQVLYFWLSCIIAAFWDTAFLPGPTKQALYTRSYAIHAILIAAALLLLAAHKQASNHGGWKSMKSSDWKKDRKSVVGQTSWSPQKPLIVTIGFNNQTLSSCDVRPDEISAH